MGILWLKTKKTGWRASGVASVPDVAVGEVMGSSREMD